MVGPSQRHDSRTDIAAPAAGGHVPGIPGCLPGAPPPADSWAWEDWEGVERATALRALLAFALAVIRWPFYTQREPTACRVWRPNAAKPRGCLRWYIRTLPARYLPHLFRVAGLCTRPLPLPRLRPLYQTTCG